MYINIALMSFRGLAESKYVEYCLNVEIPQFVREGEGPVHDRLEFTFSSPYFHLLVFIHSYLPNVLKSHVGKLFVLSNNSECRYELYLIVVPIVQYVYIRRK